MSQVKTLAKKRGYSSSSYVKYLLKADEDLISETDLLKMVRVRLTRIQTGNLSKQDQSLIFMIVKNFLRINVYRQS